MINKIVFRSWVIFLILFATSLQAKNNRIKYGKVQLEDIQSAVCPIDSAALAYYLVDKGRCEFIFNRSFEINMRRHLRIKILDDKMLDLATFTFEIFKENGFADYAIEDVKGQTYNWEGGAVVVSKLNQDSIVSLDADKYKRLVSFSLPDVKVGSVIELTYTLTSWKMNKLMPWQFQHDIPVLKSNYRVVIPEYFKYKQYPYGDVGVAVEQLSSTDKIVFASNAEFVYMTETIDYKAENVPAYQRIGTRPVSDLGARVEFELDATYVSDMLREMIAYDFRDALPYLEPAKWTSVYRQLKKSEDFGRRLEDVKDINQLKSKLSTTNDTLELIQSAFDVVKASMAWNGEQSCFALKPLDESMRLGQGNVADINLSLVALLRAVGCEAYPLVLSTKDNGFVRKYHATSTVFNYSIAACVYQGELLLLDAAGDVSAINELPISCQNGDGFMLKELTYHWVPLERTKSEN